MRLHVDHTQSGPRIVRLARKFVKAEDIVKNDPLEDIARDPRKGSSDNINRSVEAKGIFVNEECQVNGLESSSGQ